MGTESIELMLSGGHHNSLGRTVEVVELVLANPERFGELFDCYKSNDALVRLRTSSAIKRVEREKQSLVLPFLDQLINEIGKLDQASAQWTLALLFDGMKEQMSTGQHTAALAIMKRNLASHQDWIVLNTTMEILTRWAKNDTSLQQWLLPQLTRLTDDRRKSVAKRAIKMLKTLNT